MAVVRFETITVAVAGPIEGHADGRLWRWSVRHQIETSLPLAEGSADTQREAWADAGAAAAVALDEMSEAAA